MRVFLSFFSLVSSAKETKRKQFLLLCDKGNWEFTKRIEKVIGVGGS